MEFGVVAEPLLFCVPVEFCVLTEPACGFVVVVVVLVVVEVWEFPLVCELLLDGVVAVWPALPVESVLLGDVLWATTQVAHSRRTDNNVVRVFIMECLRGSMS